MDEVRYCPYCAEAVSANAHLCKHCRSYLGGGETHKEGKLVKVRVKTAERTYTGEIFIPKQLVRVSEVINDSRTFVILANAKEETKSSESDVGTLALNKRIIEWVRFIGSD